MARMFQKNKDHHSERNINDRWLISYADFITLLFAMFAVMYAVTNISLERYKTLFYTLNIQAMDFKQMNVQKAQQKILEGIPLELYLSNLKAKLTGDNNSVPYQKLLKALNDAGGAYDSKDVLAARKPETWLEIELKSMFDSASAIPKEECLPVMKKIASLLKNYNNPISIGGYTDNDAINNAFFPSNWELSAARAAAVVRLLEQNGVRGERLTAVGYGEMYPIADNASADGRDRNRRIAFLVATDKDLEAKLNAELAPYSHEYRLQHPGEQNIEVNIKKIGILSGDKRLPGDFRDVAPKATPKN